MAGYFEHATRIVCGYLACDKRLAEPIIGRLPRLLKVSLRDGTAAAWVRTSIQYSVVQSASQRPGSAMVLARLSEVLFAEAIRQHVDTLPPEETGWLAALRDRYVGRTFTLLHDKPAHPWTVDELAEEGRAVALGARSALCRADRKAAHGIPHALAHPPRGQAPAREPRARHLRSQARSATNRKPLSTGRSNASWACRPPRGGGRRRAA